VLDANSLMATALGVEAAVVHNFVWHEHLTWAERRALTRKRLFLRLLAFNATTGAVSIAGNLCIVWLLIGQMHLGLLAANLCAVGACSLVNFAINDRIVFRAAGKAASAANSC
ncbi:MAG: GtrA family protein, partial [Candidatus Acidiferrales bacterium]